jgi:hypothetical protein
MAGASMTANADGLRRIEGPEHFVIFIFTSFSVVICFRDLLDELTCTLAAVSIKRLRQAIMFEPLCPRQPIEQNTTRNNANELA